MNRLKPGLLVLATLTWVVPTHGIEAKSKCWGSRCKPIAFLSPYVGPTGAHRPIGYGGLPWLKEHVHQLRNGRVVHCVWPEQFLPNGEIRPDYVPLPRGKTMLMRGIAKCVRMSRRISL